MFTVWILTFFICSISASDYYVATYGDDDNPGTFESPFQNIQRASEVMISGDICYIRQGVYHELVSVIDQDGINGSEIVFTNYNKIEAAVSDGEDITALAEFADKVLQFKQNTLYFEGLFFSL